MAGWLLPDWPAPAGVRALVTPRYVDGLGVSQPPFDRFNLGNRHAADGDQPAAVAANRAELVQHARLPSAPCWLRQVHGTRVQAFDRAPALATDGLGDEPEADAATTVVPGVVLAVLSADCLPVLFCSRAGDEVAAAHAGWRGLAAGVLEATLSALRAPPETVLAWLGPAAGPQAYEVGDEVRAAFVDRDPASATAFAATRPGHWHCDLYALARRRLRQAGVEAVSGGDECTISRPQRWFSHRRDGRSGRLASLVWIER